MPIASAAIATRHAPPAEQARAIAQALLDGFNKHYALFRECARAGKRHFEAGNWLAIQHVARDRIDFYDRRVVETGEHVMREFRTAGLDRAGSDSLWEQVKLHYIGLLIDHKQPECAETFFNSVSTKILHRAYFHNRFIFVRPAISTEHIDAEPPSYKSYYPLQQGLRDALVDIVLDLRFERQFADFRRDLRNLLAAFRQRFPRPFALEPNHQIQVLSSPFFRNQTAYVVGRIVNGISTYPFVVPVKHDHDGKLYLDALLTDEADLAFLFSANRAYFLVDMEVPSAYIAFLRAVLPDKTAAELYTMVGLQKAGKNLFFRDFLHHLKHSRDKFIIAPGIKGHGDERVHAAVLPVCVQGDQGQDRRVEGHHSPAGPGQVHAGQAPRPRGPDDRHSRVLERRVPARALFAGPDRRTGRRGTVRRSNSTAAT